VIGLGIGLLVIEVADQVSGDDDTETDATRVAGSPDFIAYCRVQNVDRPEASVTSNDAWGWRCVGVRNGVFGADEIVVDDVCADQFAPDARARLVDPASPDGWQCVVPG
jgi:hypothetical protein